jgi:hypothetical protein
MISLRHCYIWKGCGKFCGNKKTSLINKRKNRNQVFHLPDVRYTGAFFTEFQLQEIQIDHIPIAICIALGSIREC